MQSWMDLALCCCKVDVCMVGWDWISLGGGIEHLMMIIMNKGYKTVQSYGGIPATGILVK